MKASVKAQKETYLQPVCTIIKLQTESHMMVISAGTTNPKEGGDPTGGNGNTPNPFGASPSKFQWFDEEN